MKFSKVRIIIPLVIFLVLCFALLTRTNWGTLCGFGPDLTDQGFINLSALCPLGAFTTMISTRTFAWRPIICIVIMAVLVFLVGRAYCAYVCPVTLIEKLKVFFRSPAKRKQIEREKHDELIDISKYEISCGHHCSTCAAACASQKRPKFDGRHGILLGALLSSAIFQFPVFCLVCPVGLCFAAILLVTRCFTAHDPTIQVVFVLAILIIELFVLRKWCIRFCPLAALMDLVSRFSKTVKPVIDNSKCMETSKGVPCSRCAIACEHGINLRHPDFGEHDLAACTRCRDCIGACPTKAISMPIFYKQEAPVWPGKLAGKAADAEPVEIMVDPTEH